MASAIFSPVWGSSSSKRHLPLSARRAPPSALRACPPVSGGFRCSPSGPHFFLKRPPLHALPRSGDLFSLLRAPRVLLSSSSSSSSSVRALRFSLFPRSARFSFFFPPPPPPPPLSALRASSFCPRSARLCPRPAPLSSSSSSPPPSALLHYDIQGSPRCRGRGRVHLTNHDFVDGRSPGA